MTFLFRIVWGIDVIVALVALLFFVWGINDGSVSSFNMALWVGILAALAIVVFGSRALHLKERRVARHAPRRRAGHTGAALRSPDRRDDGGRHALDLAASRFCYRRRVGAFPARRGSAT